MKSELVVVISFDSHNTTFASWHIFTCHNALRLFKNSHNTKFRVVAVSVMPQRVVVVFSSHERFRSLGLAYTQFTNVTAERITQPGGPRDRHAWFKARLTNLKPQEGHTNR